MTIYILSQDHAETARWLDDRSLDKMIKDIAQVLCNVHYELYANETSKFNVAEYFFRTKKIPLNPSDGGKIITWTRWGRKCRANYSWLVSLLDYLLWEQIFRFEKLHDGKYHGIFKWTRDHVPRLGIKYEKWGGGEREAPVTAPLVMPSKYKEYHTKSLSCGVLVDDLEQPKITESYRNYYQEKIVNSFKKQQQKTFDIVQDPIILKSISELWTRRQKPEWLKL